MPFEDDADDEWPPPDRLLPPEDRLWRHPSEIGASAGDDGAAPPTGNRTPARAGRLALAGTILVGATAVFGVMWLAVLGISGVNDSVDVTDQAMPETTRVSSARPTPTPVAVTGAGGVASDAMAASYAPSVARVEARHDDTWTTSSALWIDDDGTLVSSAARVTTADELMVMGTDGTRQPATVAGIDEATGLAALTVDHTSGIAVEAAVDDPWAGQRAAAIGCGSRDRPDPRDAVTVAAVVVRSMDERAMVHGTLLHGVIHLDRKLPADVDGGALVSPSGHLLGLIAGNSDDQGVGAVIPASTAIDTARALRDDGHVDRSWLGVQAVDVDPARATMLHLTGGARLTEVTPDSPAATAGLQADDVVVAVGDELVLDASDLVLALRAHPPKSQTSITVRRGPEQLDVTVTLGG